MSHDHAAFVVSLDFELHWGVRDTKAVDGPYCADLLGGRSAVRRMLQLFRDYRVRATWGVVGRLFARSRAELQEYRPSILPTYLNPALARWDEPIGADEDEDPFHFAPSLIDAIGATPGQEIGTHTFSHYYCLEPGQTREAFAADLRSASAIAAARGIGLETIIFPRNQRNPLYDDILLEQGIRCYRGNASGWMYRPAAGVRDRRTKRLARFVDMYVPIAGHHTYGWNEVLQRNGLANVPASFFLRPLSGSRVEEALRFQRIRRAMHYAAEKRRIFHIWWHPHNFGAKLEENLGFFQRLLDEFSKLNADLGMKSLAMRDVARQAGAGI